MCTGICWYIWYSFMYVCIYIYIYIYIYIITRHKSYINLWEEDNVKQLYVFLNFDAGGPTIFQPDTKIIGYNGILNMTSRHLCGVDFHSFWSIYIYIIILLSVFVFIFTSLSIVRFFLLHFFVVLSFPYFLYYSSHCWGRLKDVYVATYI